MNIPNDCFAHTCSFLAAVDLVPLLYVSKAMNGRLRLAMVKLRRGSLDKCMFWTRVQWRPTPATDSAYAYFMQDEAGDYFAHDHANTITLNQTYKNKQYSISSRYTGWHTIIEDGCLVKHDVLMYDGHQCGPTTTRILAPCGIMVAIGWGDIGGRIRRETRIRTYTHHGLEQVSEETIRDELYDLIQLTPWMVRAIMKQ